MMAASTSGGSALGSGWSSLGTSAANTSRLVGASAQPQAAMSSSKLRRLSTADCATAAEMVRPCPAATRRPRQGRVRFQAR
jgi:hypothetical protein